MQHDHFADGIILKQGIQRERNDLGLAAERCDDSDGFQCNHMTDPFRLRGGNRRLETGTVRV